MTAASDGMMWVPEVTLAGIVGVPRSTYLSWDKEGLVRRPASGACTEIHVVEGIICRHARAQLSVNATRTGMHRLREPEALERIVDLVRDPETLAVVDLVVNKDRSAMQLCLSARELARAVRDPHGPRESVVVPLGPPLAAAMEVFRNEANRGVAPTARRRGRPAKGAAAPVIRLKGG